MLRPGRQVHLSGTKFGISWVQAAHLLGLLAGSWAVSPSCTGSRALLSPSGEERVHFFARPLAQHTRLSQWAPTGWLDFGRGIRLTRSVPEQHYVQCKRNIRAYCENLKYHGQKERELYIQQQQAAAAELLRPLQKEPVGTTRSDAAVLATVHAAYASPKILGAQRAWGRLSMHGLSLAQITRMKPIVPGCWSPTWGNMMCYGTGVWWFDEASVHLVLKAQKIVSGAACRNFTWALGDRHVCLSHLGLECRSHCHIQCLDHRTGAARCRRSGMATRKCDSHSV